MDTIYNANGCFYRALDDEPVFVLLARDPSAAEAVRWWVTLRQALIGSGEKPLEDHETLAEAMQTAAAMRAWRSDATDPAVWGPGGKRWQTEQAPARELVETGLLDKLRSRILKDANQFLQYAANHFAKDTEEAWAKGEVNWQHYLDCCADLGINPADKPTGGSKAAAEIISKAPWYAETIRRAIDLGTEGEAHALVNKHIRELPDDALVTFHASTIQAALASAMRNRDKAKNLAISLSADTSGVREALRKIADELDAAINGTTWPNTRKDQMHGFASRVRSQVEKVMPLPFIAVDLAAKMATGLGQVADDLAAFVGDKDTERAKELLAFVDRLRGYAAELADGRMVGERLRTRHVGKSPLLGEPYGTERVERAVDTAMREQPDIYREIMETPPHFGEGESYDPERYRKGHADPAPSDMVDVTDTPDLPPHRFTMFTKARGWAYGRGLEINPSHIPDMLDKMAEDGWHLQCVFGGVVPDKVGMLFRRPTYSAFEIAHGYGGGFQTEGEARAEESENMRRWRAGEPLGDWPDAPLPDTKPFVQEIGQYEGWSVFVAEGTPETIRACLRSAMALPCGPDGMGRGLDA